MNTWGLEVHGCNRWLENSIKGRKKIKTIGLRQKRVKIRIWHIQKKYIEELELAEVVQMEVAK